MRHGLEIQSGTMSPCNKKEKKDQDQKKWKAIKEAKEKKNLPPNIYKEYQWYIKYKNRTFGPLFKFMNYKKLWRVGGWRLVSSKTLDQSVAIVAANNPIIAHETLFVDKAPEVSVVPPDVVELAPVAGLDPPVVVELVELPKAKAL